MNLKKTCAVMLLLAMILTMPAMATSSRVKRVLTTAVGQIGAPYALYSDAPNSFNCASYVAYCFNRVEEGTITGRGINSHYHRFRSMGKVKPGDVVCFRTSASGPINIHMGIYLGKGYFAHASNKAGKVTVSRLKRYRKSFVGSIRIF